MVYDHRAIRPRLIGSAHLRSVALASVAISIARFKESLSISPSPFVTPNLVGIL